MRRTTRSLILQGGLILAGALVVSSIGGWAHRATADEQPVPAAPAALTELRSLTHELEAARGETVGHQGLWAAIEEFLAEGMFRLKQRYENNNGLTVLERISG